jgi:dsDNA-specific endonuclease/ATPase MutS2
VDDTKKNKDFWELDLHIHELIETERGLSNADMLRHQMQVFKNFFRKAKDERVRKLVVIHGVGKGVLKEEVRSFLSTQDGVEYFDADFREYGKGATEVQLLYR